MSSPIVDCRLWAEENYQEILEIIKEVRREDIQRYVNGEAALLPHRIRKQIADFIEANDAQ